MAEAGIGKSGSMKKRPPFRLTSDQRLEQIRVLSACENFAVPVITRLDAIAMIGQNEAKLDLKSRRLVVSIDIGDSLGGQNEN